MNSSTALMSNTTGLAANGTSLAALPPPPGLVTDGVHNATVINSGKDALPVSTPLRPARLTYADRHAHSHEAHVDLHDLHEPPWPHHGIAVHQHHHHHLDMPHTAAKETTLELQPCNKHDPNQLEIVLFSHQIDDYRHVDGDDDAAPRSPTALLIGCTSRLNSGKLAYKIDPAFHSIGSRAKYANYVRKRNLSAAAAVAINDKRDLYSDNDGASTCNSLSDRFDARCSKRAAAVRPVLAKRMLGASPDDDVKQLKTRDQDVSPGSLMIKRAIQAAEVANKKLMAKREEADAFIRRWASGNEQPRSFEPLDEPLMIGRDVQDNMPLETRSLNTGYAGGAARLFKRDFAGGEDDQDALEERARGSTTNGGAARRPVKRNVRLLKRNIIGGDDEQDALEERARVSTTNGGARRPTKRDVVDDDFEKRSTTNGGNNGYAGYVGRWNRRALSVGDMDEQAFVQRRSLDVMPRMQYVRRMAEADLDKRSGHSGGSGHGWHNRRWRRDVAEDDDQLEKRSGHSGGSGHGWRYRRWRRDVAARDELEKRSHNGGGSHGGYGGGGRWRRELQDNGIDDDAMTTRSVLSAHGDIFPRGADGAHEADTVV